MLFSIETEFDRICNLVSKTELRCNPRAKKKMLQMRRTLEQITKFIRERDKKSTDKSEKKIT